MRPVEVPSLCCRRLTCGRVIFLNFLQDGDWARDIFATHGASFDVGLNEIAGPAFTTWDAKAQGVIK